MPTASVRVTALLVMALVVSVLVGCNRDGTCVKEETGRSDVCIVNATKDVRGANGTFSSPSGAAGVTYCRSLGFNHATKIMGKYTSTAEEREDAAKGVMIHYYKR